MVDMYHDILFLSSPFLNFLASSNHNDAGNAGTVRINKKPVSGKGGLYCRTYIHIGINTQYGIMLSTVLGMYKRKKVGNDIMNEALKQ